MWHFELFKMELMGIMVILNYEKYGKYIYIYIYIALDLCHYSTLPVYLVGFFLIKFLMLLIKNTVCIHEQDDYLRS